MTPFLLLGEPSGCRLRVRSVAQARNPDELHVRELVGRHRKEMQGVFLSPFSLPWGQQRLGRSLCAERDGALVGLAVSNPVSETRRRRPLACAPDAAVMAD